MAMIVCDSSSLITLADTCTLESLSFLKEKAGVDFVIPPGVKAEIIGVPMKIKALEFSSLRLKKLIDNGILTVRNHALLESKTSQILEAANRLYLVGGKPLRVLHEGEAECLALLSLLGGNAVLIDEKTTRLIMEDPLKLKEMTESEYLEKMEFDLNAYNKFKALVPQVAIMRSTELLAVAAKRGFFKHFGADEEEAFHASIYSLRAAGCSLAQEELKEYSEIKL